jgi:tetratricopeptide (TPR) repeat protein
MIDNEDRVFYQRIPEQFRTHWDDCRHEQRVLVKALMQGKPSEALENGARASERCPDDADVQLYYLDAMVQLRRFHQAEPLARRLVASPPRDLRNHGRLAYLAGLTFLELGDTSAAKPLIEAAVRLGQASCRAFVALAEAAKRRGRVVEGASHLESAYRCGGGRDASLRVAAATWLLDAKQAERARQVLDGLRGISLTTDQAEQVSALRKALGQSEPFR